MYITHNVRPIAYQVSKQDVLGGVGAGTGNVTENNLLPPSPLPKQIWYYG